jgi:hypothetical protein
MVVLKKGMFKDIFWQLEFPKYDWLGTFQGRYNDYGWLEDLPEEINGKELDNHVTDVVRFFVSKEAAEYAFNRFRKTVENGYHYTDALQMEKLFAKLAPLAGEKTPKIDRVELHPNYIETMCFVYLAHSNRMNLFGATTSQERSESYEYAKDLWEIAKGRYEALIAEEKQWDAEEAELTPKTPKKKAPAKKKPAQKKPKKKARK